ncbi:hypothetical protein B0H14DRAFT_2627204 [Mycena olivaceomarginata]|nr:hypothetical protein B0H14DRAFT_2627204 [Mycena olivaceomarginata]
MMKMYHPARAHRQNQVRTPSANIRGVSWRGKIGPNHLRHLHPRTDHKHKQRADVWKNRHSLHKWMLMAGAWALPNTTGSCERGFDYSTNPTIGCNQEQWFNYRFLTRPDGTFDVVAEQYTGATRNVECFPTRCLIPDTPRFQKFKPVPSKGKFVSVTGFFTGVERDEDHTVTPFLIDVDQVAFLGKQSALPKAKQSPAKIGVFNLSNFLILS